MAVGRQRIDKLAVHAHFDQVGACFCRDVFNEWRILQQATALAADADFLARHRLNPHLASLAKDLQVNIEHRQHGAVRHHHFACFLALDRHIRAASFQVAHQALYFLNHQPLILHFLDLFVRRPPVFHVAVFEQQRVLDGVMQHHPAVVVLHDDLIDVIRLDLGLAFVFLTDGIKLSNRTALREDAHDGRHRPIHRFAQVF